jgi:hypothetical protein
MKKRVASSEKPVTLASIAKLDSPDNADPSDHDLQANREEESRIRNEKRSNTLRAFLDSQPRNSWAEQAEIELRNLALPKGVSVDKLSCRADICRLDVSGPEAREIFDFLSHAQKRTRTFSRTVSNKDGTVRIEAFLSPSSTRWPTPVLE